MGGTLYSAAEWPAEHRDAYLAEPPVFDVSTAEAVRGHGRIPERVRTWPRAERCSHPEAGVVAVGARARWLTAAAALAAGIGVRGHVGQADSHLFPAPELTAFAVSWIEDHFT